MEYYSTLKRNELSKHEKTCKRSERSQSEKTISSLIPTYDILERKTKPRDGKKISGCQGLKQGNE